MLWDCRYCGTQKLLGLTHRHCPTCGAPQDATARYFPAPHERVEVHSHVFVGADVVCPSCQEANSKRSEHCFNCGAPLTEAAAVRRRLERDAQAGVDSREAAIAELAPPAAPSAAAGKEKAAGKRKQSKASGGTSTIKRDLRTLALIFVPLILLFCANIIFTKTVSVQVAAHHWVREIQVERYGEVSEGAWCDKVPAGGRVTGRELADRGSRKVADGKTCTTRQSDNGDGTFSEREVCKTKYRSEPIQDYYCTYLITKWHASRVEKAEGDFSRPPAWPELHLAKQGQCIGCERAGSRSEHYKVVVRDQDSGDQETCEFDEAKWRKLQPGASYAAERMVVGGIVCDLIEP